MHVKGLLEGKGADVITASTESSVADVAALLATHRIGAVVISSGKGHIDGIVSERDIVRAVATRGPVALDDDATAIMTSMVFTCGHDTTVEQVMALMTDRRIRHVPVVADGVLAGIISIGDVVKHRMGELETETQVLHDYITNGR